MWSKGKTVAMTAVVVMVMAPLAKDSTTDSVAAMLIAISTRASRIVGVLGMRPLSYRTTVLLFGVIS